MQQVRIECEGNSRLRGTPRLRPNSEPSDSLRPGSEHSHDVPAGGTPAETPLPREVFPSHLPAFARIAVDADALPQSIGTTEHHDLAVATAAVPHSVVCLISALRFHDIGTQLPAEGLKDS